MRVREMGYVDYKMEDKEVNRLLKLCQSADIETEKLILQAAQESDEEIASVLFYSLRNNVSYDDLYEKDRVFIGKGDFYGYRRKTLYLLNERINERASNEKWLEKDYIRRYLCVEKVAEELGIRRERVIKLAEKANAIMRIGRTVHINMIALYDYLDNNIKEQKGINK